MLRRTRPLPSTGVLIAARSGSPLVIGVGDKENYIASDATALIKYTRKVMYLDDGQIAEIRADRVSVQDLSGAPQSLEIKTVDWDLAMAEKGGYPHFMLKEIHEQPEVLRNVMRGRIAAGGGDVTLEDIKLAPDILKNCPRIYIVACGTAMR